MKHDLDWEIKQSIRIVYRIVFFQGFCCHFAAMRKMCFLSGYINAVLSHFLS
jgi:hypothetical protein